MSYFIHSRYSNIVSISPHVLRSMYQSLTLDAAVDQNALMDERMRMAVLGEPDLIVDLRKLNKGRPGDTFNLFFEEMAKEVEQVNVDLDLYLQNIIPERNVFIVCSG